MYFLVGYELISYALFKSHHTHQQTDMKKSAAARWKDMLWKQNT